jgi:hypothetical protein
MFSFQIHSMQQVFDVPSCCNTNFDLIERKGALSSTTSKSFLFFLSTLWCSQSADDPQECLANFGYKLNMKINVFTHLLNMVFGYLLDVCVERNGVIFV